MSASLPLVIPQHVAEKLTRESCANCKFLHKDDDGDQVCRRNPPTAWLVASPLGPPHRPGTMGFQIQSGYPVVEPRPRPGLASQKWCGEWKPRVVQ